jgi:hypothetical protein
VEPLPQGGVEKGHSTEAFMGRGLILWLLGIPLPVILLLWLFGFFH